MDDVTDRLLFERHLARKLIRRCTSGLVDEFTLAVRVDDDPGVRGRRQQRELFDHLESVGVRDDDELIFVEQFTRRDDRDLVVRHRVDDRALVGVVRTLLVQPADVIDVEQQCSEQPILDLKRLALCDTRDGRTGHAVLQHRVQTFGRLLGSLTTTRLLGFALGTAFSNIVAFDSTRDLHALVSVSTLGSSIVL